MADVSSENPSRQMQEVADCFTDSPHVEESFKVVGPKKGKAKTAKAKGSAFEASLSEASASANEDCGLLTGTYHPDAARYYTTMESCGYNRGQLELWNCDQDQLAAKLERFDTDPVGALQLYFPPPDNLPPGLRATYEIPRYMENFFSIENIDKLNSRNWSIKKLCQICDSLKTIFAKWLGTLSEKHPDISWNAYYVKAFTALSVAFTKYDIIPSTRLIMIACLTRSLKEFTPCVELDYAYLGANLSAPFITSYEQGAMKPGSAFAPTTFQRKFINWFTGRIDALASVSSPAKQLAPASVPSFTDSSAFPGLVQLASSSKPKQMQVLAKSQPVKKSLRELFPNDIKVFETFIEPKVNAIKQDGRYGLSELDSPSGSIDMSSIVFGDVAPNTLRGQIDEISTSVEMDHDTRIAFFKEILSAMVAAHLAKFSDFKAIKKASEEIAKRIAATQKSLETLLEQQQALLKEFEDESFSKWR